MALFPLPNQWALLEKWELSSEVLPSVEEAVASLEALPVLIGHQFWEHGNVLLEMDLRSALASAWKLGDPDTSLQLEVLDIPVEVPYTSAPEKELEMTRIQLMHVCHQAFSLEVP